MRSEVAVFLLVWQVVLTTGSVCDQGWYNYRDTKCFIPYQVPVNYSEAENLCRVAHNAELLRIDSDNSEFEFITFLLHRVLRVDKSVWLQRVENNNNSCKVLHPLKRGNKAPFEYIGCDNENYFVCQYEATPIEIFLNEINRPDRISRDDVREFRETQRIVRALSRSNGRNEVSDAFRKYAPPPPFTRCQAGWVQFKNEKCLLMASKGPETQAFVDFFTAELLCHVQFNATLATVQSQEEQEFLDEWLFGRLDIGNIDYLHVWVGARRDRFGIFRWVDGSGLSFQNWKTGEPSSAMEECLEIWRVNDNVEGRSVGRWNDRNCDARNYVICEKKLP